MMDRRKGALKGRGSLGLYAFVGSTYCLSLIVLWRLAVFSGCTRCCAASPAVLFSDTDTQTAWRNLLVDALLALQFCIVHSAVATDSAKSIIAHSVGNGAARAVQVLISSASLALCVATPLWKETPYHRLWFAMPGSPTAAALATVRFLAWVTVALQSLCLDHFALFGLRQAFAYAQGRRFPMTAGISGERIGDGDSDGVGASAATDGMRHPIFIAFVAAIWFPRTMTLDRLLFAAVLTVYPVVANRLTASDASAVDRCVRQQFGDVVN